jgi:opacity protein-like surface antigen
LIRIAYTLVKKLEGYLFCIALFISLGNSAQVANPIKVKKSKNTYLFYQAGHKTDTVTNSKGNQFYLAISDSLKPFMNLQIENGRFVKTGNDSVYKLEYVFGVNYECSYSKYEKQKSGREEEAGYSFKSLINGASTRPKNEIFIRFKIEVRPNSQWEGKYYYRN